MVEFKFSCPQCGQSVEADGSLRGRAVECPFCGKGIVVPRIEPHSPLESRTQPPKDAPEPDGARAPKLRRIRQERAADSCAGAQAVPSFPGQADGHVPSPAPLLPVTSDELEGKGNDTGMITGTVLVFCLVVALVVGGGLLIVSRCDRKCAALKTLIEQAGGRPDEQAPQLSDRMEKRARELEGTHAALSKGLEVLSRRVDDMEATCRRSGEDWADRNRSLEEKYVSLQERIESLSRHVAEDSGSAHRLDQDEPRAEPPRRAQADLRDEPTAPADLPETSLADLQKQLNGNLAELKELMKKNPACYLQPSLTTIVNVEKKIATMKDRRYCTCVNITLVRDCFYCSGCKRVTGYRGGERDSPGWGCCNVSSKQSFHRWWALRAKVDETASINSRIDELYAENASLEKQIRLAKRSGRRR